MCFARVKPSQKITGLRGVQAGYKFTRVKPLHENSRMKGMVKPVVILLLFTIVVYQLMPQGAKAGYSFQANYDDGSRDAYNALGSRTGSTDTSLPDVATGYNGTNSLSYSYDGTSTLKYPTASNLPADKGSIEMKFQKSAYGSGSDQDTGSMNRPRGIYYDSASQLFILLIVPITASLRLKLMVQVGKL